MTFRLLSELVSELRTVWISKLKPSALPTIQMNAGLLQMATYGPRVPSAMVNVCALAVSTADRLRVHSLRADAVALVQQTDVRSFADHHPSLLDGPFLIESSDVKKPLFLDVVSIGGYQIDGVWYLVILSYPDGIVVTQWDPHWQEDEVGLGLYHVISPDLQAEAEEKLIDAVRFITTFSMLLDAENTPVTVRHEPRVPKNRSSGKKEKFTNAQWSVNYVSLSQQPVHTRSETVGTQTIDGLVLSDVRVSGHLRAQRHGPGRSQMKIIYVREFASRRWVAPNKRVVVTA